MRTPALMVGLVCLLFVSPATAAVCGIQDEPCCPVPAVAQTPCDTGLTCIAGICDNAADPTGVRPLPVASTAGIVASVLLLAGLGGHRLRRGRLA